MGSNRQPEGEPRNLNNRTIKMLATCSSNMWPSNWRHSSAKKNRI